MRRHAKKARLDDVVLNAMAFAWLGRGVWRIYPRPRAVAGALGAAQIVWISFAEAPAR